MKDYIDGCLIGLTYILIGCILMYQENYPNTCIVFCIVVLLLALYICLVPYKMKKSLYLLFLEKIKLKY